MPSAPDGGWRWASCRPPRSPRRASARRRLPARSRRDASRAWPCSPRAATEIALQISMSKRATFPCRSSLVQSSGSAIAPQARRPAARIWPSVPAARAGSGVPAARIWSGAPAARIWSGVPAARAGSGVPAAPARCGDAARVAKASKRPPSEAARRETGILVRSGTTMKGLDRVKGQALAHPPPFPVSGDVAARRPTAAGPTCRSTSRAKRRHSRCCS